jgi:apolipoprotein N-acyltransferase
MKPLIQSKPLLGLILALLLGASLVFSFAPFSIWFVTPLALATFFYLIKQLPLNYAFKLGFSFGVGWFASGVHWVHVSIDQYGGLPLIFSLALMMLLIAYLALFPALFAYSAKRFFPTSSWLVALPALWGICELLRSWFLTGFPWLSIGYGQIDGPLANWATLIGETGLSLVVVMLSWTLVNIANKGLLRSLKANKISPAKLQTILVFALFALPLLLSSFNKPVNSDRVATITLVQGNIPQSMRWVPEQDWPTMEKYLDLTEPHWQSDVIIWPEAAVPKIEPLAQEYLQFVDYKAFENKTAVITGIADYNLSNKQAYNNLIVLGTANSNDQISTYSYGHSNRYSKHHLLPIGEFIPLEDWLRGLAPIFDLPMSSFTRGDYMQHNLVANDLKIAANICFEILFSQQIIDNLDTDTDVLLTVSNDAWFGDSIGPIQHMEIARMRALELGLPVLRSTNNGVTGIINEKGVVVSQIPQFEDAVLNHQLQLNKVQTLFATSHGLTYWLVLFILIIAAIILARKTNI